MAFHQVKPLEVMVIALYWVLSVQQHSSSVHGAQQVPCFFIFGDSQADSGNNNLLDSLAKVNYKPYGIDFPGGATGRFSNGRSTVDILSQLLGFNNFIPPFALLNSSDILKGVNYASGAAGIREETGSQLGARISLDGQLKNHEITISRIADILGDRGANRLQRSYYSSIKQWLAKRHLNQCLYSIGMGSNDFINNYFLPQHYNTSKSFTTEQYAEALITQYSEQIKKLYNFGARKVVLVGVGIIGCTPTAISAGKNGSACLDIMNSAAQQFNQKLVSLVDQLNKNFTDAKFIYINSFGMGTGDPAAAGFKIANVGCCEVNEVGQCKIDGIPCQNRSEYVFWDGFHPTEAANRLTAIRSYNAFSPSDTYPMDISHLVQLKLEPKFFTS
ncbi:GDSL esterase/lipase At1g29670-like [Argentina anserina]|uniref:GDSL esterase/lipase At1g29670-like n=1 Tax=Argentina anserina TaxID=57926 RepID=UPI0021768D13|nr:GDSL esterase/lipase At1g29670-like [Potentilla anserina]